MSLTGHSYNKKDVLATATLEGNVPETGGASNFLADLTVKQDGSGYELKKNTSTFQIFPVQTTLPFPPFTSFTVNTTDVVTLLADYKPNTPLFLKVIKNDLGDFMTIQNSGTGQLFLVKNGKNITITSYRAFYGEVVTVHKNLSGDYFITLVNEQVFQTKYILRDITELLHIHPANANNEIFLENNTYVIDSRDFQLGIYKLKATVPVSITGISQAINKISTSEDNTILIDTTSDLFLSNIQLQAEGNNSKCINMAGSTGFESLDMQYVQFTGNSKYGSIDNIRQGFWTDGFSFNAKEGFDLSNAIGGFTIFNTRVINTGNYILKGNTGCTINNVRSNINCDILTGDVAFDFDYEMFNDDRGYQLANGTYNGVGQMVSNFTNGNQTEAHKSRKSYFTGNQGNLGKNTRIGGEWVVTNEAVTPLTQNSSVKVLGTTTSDNLEHVISNNNELIHNSTVPTDYKVDGDLTFDGGPNDILRLEIKRFNNLTNDFTTLKTYTANVNNFQGGQDRVFFRPFVSVVEMQELDRIEIYIVNETDNTDVTLKLNSLLTIKEI